MGRRRDSSERIEAVGERPMNPLPHSDRERVQTHLPITLVEPIGSRFRVLGGIEIHERVLGDVA
jgi:hypothetical protein